VELEAREHVAPELARAQVPTLEAEGKVEVQPGDAVGEEGGAGAETDVEELWGVG
jgi:hypothetical protein